MAPPHSHATIPPEARFWARCTAAGLAIDEVGTVLRADPAAARRLARLAVRASGGPPIAASADDATLSAALAALGVAPRAASTACPAPDVARALAAGALDGPLLLAEAEHAADCEACLSRLVGLIQSPPADTAGPAASAVPLWPAIAGAAVGAAAALAWLLA